VNVRELIEKLAVLPDQEMTVCAQDGLDPSDSEPIETIEIFPHWQSGETCVHLM
jgi:hypothetical protein